MNSHVNSQILSKIADVVISLTSSPPYCPISKFQDPLPTKNFQRVL